ncbi:hypothetical protein [Streptomyces sp. TRM64462]|uniref:hypothetical protein n=1 Tax=Streptomyces sp. TRM64462 TaxID=2741726 RepID=UPI0015867831|nr:hypothetical protein [Streptomyces sp. TRM64462]
MGIESDQLVFDYLSRVGDLAQQRQLPSQQRMNLVASLRDEISRERADGGGDTPAAVRRILSRLGTPDAVVTAVENGGLAVPEQRTARTTRLRGGTADARHAEGEPQWWRVEEGAAAAPPGDLLAGGVAPGFEGGVEIPEILEPPKKKPDGTPEKTDGTPKKPTEAAPSKLRLAGVPALLTRRRKKPGKQPEPATEAPKPPRRPFRNPVLLAAAGLLVAGVALGSWLPLAGGWLLAYASRRLSRAQAKWAVLGLPGLAAAGGAVWLWGRLDGRWGDPVPPGGDALSEALSSTWPWVIRAAAVASALYLVWRARRT